jgi:NAD(P)-dependent dehydrogenase (short-subunit alcohol dehydrogenase family)
MAEIFITGSADGLGQLAAESLVQQDHKVILHARNEKRAGDALKKTPGAADIVTGDLSSIEQTIKLADQLNEIGSFDAIIHNAGISRGSGKEIFTVNTLAPYILTCLMKKSKRLIYLSSGMHLHGHLKPESLKNNINRVTYSDSKLHNVMLCKAVSKRWDDVYANSVDPGWVPTKMGGRGAPDDLQKGYETQVWLAVSNDEKVKVTGKYFYHQTEKPSNPEADDTILQEKLMEICREITGVSFPLD